MLPVQIIIVISKRKYHIGIFYSLDKSEETIPISISYQYLAIDKAKSLLYINYGEQSKWRQSQIIKNKMNPTILSFVGHIEGKVYTSLSQDNKKLVTLGSDDLIMQWQTADMTSRRQIEIPNKNGQIYTSIQYVQKNRMFVLGTESGNVWLMSENDLNDCKLAYQCTRQGGIISIKLSASLKYLAIASGEDRAVVYDLEKQKYYRCDSGHEGNATYADLGYEDRILATLGTDGYTFIYAMQPSTINPLQLLHKYRICHTPSLQPDINFSHHPTEPYHLTYAGATTLQQLYLTLNQSSPESLTQIQCQYRIKVEIHEESQIVNVCWLNENIVILCLENSVSLWNYVTKNKFHVLNDLGLRQVVSDGIRFYGVGGTGIIYRYENNQNILFQNQQALKYLKKMQNEQNNSYNPNNMTDNEVEEPIEQKKVRQVPQPSIYGQLITKPPQLGLESYYPSHLQFQFLFYNQHGCIIKHTNNDEQIIELEYHDKFKLRKIKFVSAGKYYCYYALNARCFMYSSRAHVYFEMESERRDKTNIGTNSLIKWDYKLSDIEGLAIGNTWAAVACKDCVRLFDLFGNQLFSICYDRMFLVLAAYEDILVLGYNAAIPLAQCHIFELKVYKISNQSVKFEKTIKMPIKAEHELKMFGFSEEGYLYNQDTSETVRMYCWDSDEWVNIYEQDSTKYKLYIQHLENYQIYGFRVEQREGEPTGPTVLPRSLPRKILCQFKEFRLNQFTDEENKKLQGIYLRKLRILHEGFRSRRWYKNKYSRKENNSLYKLSEKILSQEEIEEQKAQLDIHIVGQVRKIMPNLEAKLPGSELQQVKFQLLALCHRLVFYQQSIVKINSMLGLGNPLAEYWDPEPPTYPTTRKYNQLGRLGAMVDMGWIQRNIQTIGQ